DEAGFHVGGGTRAVEAVDGARQGDIDDTVADCAHDAGVAVVRAGRHDHHDLPGRGLPLLVHVPPGYDMGHASPRRGPRARVRASRSPRRAMATRGSPWPSGGADLPPPPGVTAVSGSRG